jgi:hypothetical protein
MNPFPLNSIAPADTRIDMFMIRRAVVEGLQEYKEKNSTVCLSIVASTVSWGMLIAILVFSSAILKDIVEIKNKVGA